MKKRMLRGLALVLSLLLLCPVLGSALPAFASGAEDGERFIFEALTGEGYTVNEDGSVTLTQDEPEAVRLTEGISPVGSANSTNALYVSLHNHSQAAVTLTVSYRCYSCSDTSNGHAVSLTFAPDAEKQSAWAYAPHISSLQNDSEPELTVTFDGEEGGTVVLYSFYDVSVYDPAERSAVDAETADIVKCVYEPDAEAEGGTILFSGTLPPLYADDGSTLALFAFGPNDQDTSNVITKTPVARMALNKNFNFSVPVENAEEIYARYAVAIVTKEGERKLLCQPVYPDIRTAAVDEEAGFKGFHTDSLYTVLNSGADLEIVDVYLDRLLLPSSDSGNSILYAGDHSYYFFSETEIAALDHRIRNLTGNGCSVYLRFLVSAEAEGLSYVNQADSYIGIVNKGVDIKTETALLEIHALTDFLTKRYCNTAQGNISGIILGRAADRSSVYSYVGTQNLAAYAEKYATYLNLVAGCARSNIPGLRIVVPVSDRTHAETVTLSNLSGDYFSDLFLDSLLLAMEDLILTPPAFSVMMQSVDETQKAPEDVEPLEDFLGMIEARAGKYGFLAQDILYAWTPCTAYTRDALNAAYAFRYVKLFHEPRVSSFIVDLSLCDGADAVTQLLKYTVSGIDTTKSSTVLQPIASVYPEVFAGFDLTAFGFKSVDKVLASESSYGNGTSPNGSYPLFDFSQPGGQLAWYAGDACNSVSLVDRTLTAQFTATGNGDFAEIAYSFGTPKNYSIAPLIRFSLGIRSGEHNVNTPYEVQFRLVGEDSVIVGYSVIMAGEAGTFYLNLEQYADQLTALRSIRVLARPLEETKASYELYLKNIYLESAVLSDSELAEQIAIQTNEAQPETLPQENTDYTTPILVTGGIVLFSLAVVAVLFLKAKRRKRDRQ